MTVYREQRTGVAHIGLVFDVVAPGCARAVHCPVERSHGLRLPLELAGLKTYLEVVLVRLEPHLDFSELVLHVAGVFLRDGADMQTRWRVAPFSSWVFEHLGCICQLHSAFCGPGAIPI